ncbi:MAG: 1-deoxy-D-xylulose-5-phosphate reductoisomerase [Coprobacillus sp.]|nr:1-deoxy-D-xylulose-5-phosphate reductoisomerase [Coprobacillus sp.]
MEEILLLGASGSIGRQTLEVIARHPRDFHLVGISVGHKVEIIPDLLKRYPTIKWVYAIEEEKINYLVKSYKNIKFYYGDEGLSQITNEAEYSMMVNAISGFAGFTPTYYALLRGKKVGLANKESIVVGGDLIKKVLDENHGVIYPIDSEHSALTRCLLAEDTDIDRILLTTSGGALRNFSLSHLSSVTPAEALRHPNWDMGKLITIESALMLNKAFEVVETNYLFGTTLKDMDVVMEPNSLIHCFVKYKDGHIRLYESKPDMHIPIEFALYGCTTSEPHYGTKVIKKSDYKFPLLDPKRYPAIMYGPYIVNKGGLSGAIVNAAAEYGINEFLNQKIKFTEIEPLINQIIKEFETYEVSELTYENIIKADDIVRKRCKVILGERNSL